MDIMPLLSKILLHPLPSPFAKSPLNCAALLAVVMMMMMKSMSKMIVHVVAMVHESLAKPDALVLTGKLNLNILVLNLKVLPDLVLPDKPPDKLDKLLLLLIFSLQVMMSSMVVMPTYTIRPWAGVETKMMASLFHLSGVQGRRGDDDGVPLLP